MRIFITTSFEGIHAYKDAPEEVSFLRNPHRHMFGVRVSMDVYHDNREIEFILLKRNIDRWLSFMGKDLNNISCEQLGKNIIYNLISCYGSNRNYEVIVDEDGENGAIIREEDVK